MLANPAGRVAAFLPPDDPDPPPLVALALGPLIHASGQWSTLGTLLSGGTVVLYPDAALRRRRRCWTSSTAERVVALNLVGDAIARPLVDELEARPGRVGHVVAAAARLGREHPVRRREGPAARRAAVGPRADRRDRLVGVARAGGRGHDARRRPDAVAALHREGHDDGGRRRRCGRCPRAPGSSAGSPPPGASRSATTATPTARRARSSRSTGSRWSLPGDMATIDADGVVHLLGRGSFCINTGGEKVYPEEVEAVREVASARRRRGRRRRPRPALGRAGGRDRGAGEPDARPSTRCRSTAARTSRATRCRARCTSSTRCGGWRTARPTTVGPRDRPARGASAELIPTRSTRDDKDDDRDDPVGLRLVLGEARASPRRARRRGGRARPGPATVARAVNVSPGQLDGHLGVRRRRCGTSPDWSGAPPLDAAITRRSPSRVYTIGMTRSLPLFAPVVVSSSSGASANGPGGLAVVRPELLDHVAG